MMTLFDYAVKYRDMFGWSIIPIIPETKKPMVAWKEYQSRVATDDELYSWFVGKKPTEIGLGLVTGKVSDIAVVDNDTDEMLVDSNVKVKTGRGTHCYFRYVPGVTNKSKLSGDPIDVRGEGGYVVLPPSVHKSGHVYKWIVEGKLEEQLAQMQDFPLGIYNQYFTNATPKARVIKDYTDVIGTEIGNRDEKLFSHARSIFSYGVPFDRVLQLSRIINSTFKPPLEDSVVIEKVKSAEKFHVEDDLPKIKLGGEIIEEYTKEILENKHKYLTKTGIYRLDKSLGNMELGRIYTVVAGSGVGKSVFAVQVFDEAIKSGVKSLYLSNELYESDIITRLIARRTKLPWQDINHQQKLTPTIETAKQDIKKCLDTSHSGIIAQVNSKLKLESAVRLGKAEGIDLFILDHLHNIRGEGDLYKRISDLSHTIQELSSELNVTFLIMGQLGKADQISQNAEVVGAKGSMETVDVSDVFLYMTRNKTGDNPNEAQIAIAKNRSGGETGIVNANFKFPEGIIETPGPSYSSVPSEIFKDM